MESFSDPRKIFANNIAQELTNPENRRVVRSLDLGGILRNAAESEPARTSDEIERKHTEKQQRASSQKVGIWTLKEGPGGLCERDEADFAEWHLWANQPVIPRKQAKYRIILIGESAARGFILDPELTPVKILQSVLSAGDISEGEFEVIDLARSSIGFEVEVLVADSLSLNPDVIVFFCGNNWMVHYDRADASLIEALLQRKEISGLKKYAESQLFTKAFQLITKIAKLCRSRNIKLICVVPEFNLADWQDFDEAAPHLKADANLIWLSHFREATAALASGDFETVETLSHHMTTLDGGTNGAAARLRAQCFLASGQIDFARRNMEAARDAVIWYPQKSVYSRRPYRVVQDAIRLAASAEMISLVDIPILFKEYLHGGIPDRRLFFDYCHLNMEGLRLVVSHIASCIFKVLLDKKKEWRVFMDVLVDLDSNVKAEASFFAAVHNAHWFQPYEIVHYHCCEALKHSKAISTLMSSFLQIQTCRTPMFMSLRRK